MESKPFTENEVALIEGMLDMADRNDKARNVRLIVMVVVLGIGSVMSTVSDYRADQDQKEHDRTHHVSHQATQQKY
ncbi:hypothetical protein JKY72_00660 [Candidatus Gracilibacteria bacterium]|nr:hypothetical protein [Candidatus Gracilibacteria bacterium]